MNKAKPISVSKIQYLPCKTSIQTRPSNSSKSTRPFICARKGRRQRRQQLICRNYYNVGTITIWAGSPPNTSQVSLHMCGWECTGTACYGIGAQVFDEYRRRCCFSSRCLRWRCQWLAVERVHCRPADRSEARTCSLADVPAQHRWSETLLRKDLNVISCCCTASFVCDSILT